MLTILAVAPEDAWAFVQKGDEIYLLRPPYRSSHVVKVDRARLETAVAGGGFTTVPEADARQPTWTDVIAYLSRVIVSAREARGTPIPAIEESGSRILEHAPREMLVRFLDRAHEELIPEGRFDHAQEVLLAIIRLPIVAGDPRLVAYAASLLSDARKGQQARLRAREGFLTALKPIEEGCPRTAQRYGREAVRTYGSQLADVREKQIFPIC